MVKTQREIAKKIRVSPQHLNAVLRGRVKPSLRLALKIEQVMGIPPEQFIPELSSARLDGGE